MISQNSVIKNIAYAVTLPRHPKLFSKRLGITTTQSMTPYDLGDEVFVAFTRMQK